MGGKTWSEKEEEYFWRVVVASSAKRVGTDLAKPEKSWDLLAREMQRSMGSQARRDYTPTMLFEHFFQNVETGRKSPNAIIYVMEYLQRKGPDLSKRSRGRVARSSRGQPRIEISSGRIVKESPISRPRERPTQGGLRLPTAIQSSHDQQPIIQGPLYDPVRQPMPHILRHSIMDWRETVKIPTYNIPGHVGQSTAIDGSFCYMNTPIVANNSPGISGSDDGSLTDLHSLFSGNAEDGDPMERDSGFDSIMRDEGGEREQQQGGKHGNGVDVDVDDEEQLMVPWWFQGNVPVGTY